MKYQAILLSFIFLTVVSCKDDGPKIEEFESDRVAFSYTVTDDFPEDFYIGSPIQFKNISAATGNCTWNFGDGTTSNEAEPVHKYHTAGTYKVSLTIEGEGTTSHNLMISDIFPTVKVENAEDKESICEVRKSQMLFSVYLPNPENLQEEYEWFFPKGSINEAGEEISSYKGENPGKIVFRHVGSQKIVLKTKLGGRTLEEGVLNVQVGYDKPVKMLYYAVKGGNIMGLKLIHDAPADMDVEPFNLGVKSGNHPLNILCDDSLLYVLDAGRQFTYVNDVDGTLGDGKVSVVSTDGSIVETLISNNGGTAFNDPFYGYMDKANKVLYLSDRNTGIAKIPTDQRNLQMDRTKYPFFVANARLNYYKAGLEYGAMNACFTKSNNVWYWLKTFNGNGVFRFKDSDILSADITQGKQDDPYKVLLNGMFIKSLVIDNTRDRIYFMVRSTGDEGGLYVTTKSTFETLYGLIELNKAVTAKTCYKVGHFVSDDDGASGEYVDVCQMSLDNSDGSVYFGLRASSVSAYPTGIYRVEYNANINLTKATCIRENIAVYGITVYDKASKLF